MLFLISITLLVFSFQVANTYILLTANLDDFNTIAKQIAASPVGDQINQYVRRATALFNEQLKPQASSANNRAKDDKMNVGGHSFDVWEASGDGKDSTSDNDSLSDKDEDYSKKGKDDGVDRRTGEDEFVALGKNASYYLQSIKKLFENA